MTGFNQVANTRRAMEVLAIVSRSGKFLPLWTFGPTNGPDDFCYTVDRAFAPGRNRTLRYGKQWLAYVDDLTVRTGKWLDQRILTDVEYDEEIRAAAKKAGVQVAQKRGEALEAFGFSKRGLGDELQSKPGTGEVVSDHNHPTRMSFVPWIHAAYGSNQHACT